MDAFSEGGKLLPDHALAFVDGNTEPEAQCALALGFNGVVIVVPKGLEHLRAEDLPVHLWIQVQKQRIYPLCASSLLC